MKRCLYILLLLSLVACQSKNDPSSSGKPNNYADSAVVITEEYRLYLCNHEWTNIVISKTDPSTIDLSPWRIPTKDEATILHTKYIQSGTDQRYLCIAPDGYYSFCLSKVGNITKAGSKTKYAIRPVRKVYNPKDTIIEL